MLMKPKSTSNLSCGKKRIKHIKAPRLVDPGSNNIVERLNGIFRERNKTMRSFNNKSEAAFIGGFRIYYNFLRSHLALNGKTPAEAAKIRLP
jgi:transposase InsO family protein